MIRLRAPLLQCVLFASMGLILMAAAKPIDEAQLSKALAKYHSIEKLKVGFKQKKFLKDMNMSLESEGVLSLMPPSLVIYQLTKPAPMKVTLDPEQIKIENGSGSDAKVQIIKTSTIPGESEKRNLKAMVTWLKMDPHALAGEYEISESEKNHYLFRPHDSTSAFQSLEMELGKSGHVSHLIMKEQSGDRIEFFFETPQINYQHSVK